MEGPGQRRLAFLRRHAPLFSALASGFAVMSLELLGSRIVAPYLGSSILIWTNLIGVILVAMALGAWFGGVLADRHPEHRLVGILLIASGAWCVLLGRMAGDLMAMISRLPFGIAAPIAAILLLAPPAFLLAAVSPAVLRLSMRDVARAGHAAGIVSAMGTIGSLVGTYVTGYVLLPRLPVSDLLYVLGAFLFIIGAAIVGRRMASKTGIAVSGSLLLLPFSVAHPAHAPLVVPSAYGYVSVIHASYHGTPAELLRINNGIHAAASPDAPRRTILTYAEAMRSLDLLVANPKRMLTLGGGGFHVSDEYLARHPDAHVDVVEIDPAVLRAAQEAFGVSTSTRLQIHLADARPELAHLTPGYDLIIADAFTGDVTVPWYLLTSEAMASYRDLLTPNGVFAANMIFPAEPTDPAARSFVARSVGTFKTAFSWVHAVTLNNAESPDLPANILLIAGNGPEPDMKTFVASIHAQVGEPGIREIDLPSPGRAWTDDAGTADYESLAMVREAWKRINGW